MAIGILGLIISKMLATYMSVGERGRYDLVYTLLSFAGIAADMGLYTIAIREISKQRDQLEHIIGNIMSLRNILSIGTVIIAVLATMLIPGLQKGPEFTIAVAFSGVSMVLALMNGTITSVLQAEYKMMQSTVAQVLGKIVIVIVMAITMFFLFKKSEFPDPNQVPFWAYQWLFIAGIIGNFAMYLYTEYFVRKIVKVKFLYDFAYWKKLVKEALPYGFGLVLATLYFKIDVLILNFMLPHTATLPDQTADFQIGLYSGAVKVVEIFSILPLFFLNATLPVMSRLIAEGSERIKTVLQYSLEFLYLMAAPIAVGGFVLAYHIVNITNDHKYLTRLQDGFIGSDFVLKIIIFTILFSFLNLLFNFLLVAQNRQKKLVIINSVCLLFNSITNIIFIPAWGIRACAVTTVVTEILVLILTIYYSRQMTTFQPHWGRLLRITFAALCMGAVMEVIKNNLFVIFQNPAIIMVGGIGILVYVGLLVLLRVVNRELIMMMKKG